MGVTGTQLGFYSPKRIFVSIEKHLVLRSDLEQHKLQALWRGDCLLLCLSLQYLAQWDQVPDYDFQALLPYRSTAIP